MKKLSTIAILVVSILILFTGCQPSSAKYTEFYENSDFDYKNDMQVMYLTSGGQLSAPMTKSDTGYYYVAEAPQFARMVFYIDKEIRKATPLCSKPNCLHDDLTKCDAYINISQNVKISTSFGASGNIIQYYGGYLYYLGGEYDQSGINYNTFLMRMDLDGNNKVQLTECFDYHVTHWCLHRGYLYYFTDSELCRVPIDSIKSEPSVIYEVEYYIEEAWNTFETMYTYKNYIYFTVLEEDEQGKGPGRQTYCVNLDTMEKTLITIDGNCASVEGFTENKVIVSFGDKTGKVYESIDLNGTNGKEFYYEKRSDVRALSTDNKYFYFDNLSKTVRDSSITQMITVTDKDCNLVDTFKLPPLDVRTYNFFVPQDEDFFIFECFNENDEHVIVMADKSQIGSINGEVIEYTELCKLKWAQGNSNGIYYTE